MTAHDVDLDRFVQRLRARRLAGDASFTRPAAELVDEVRLRGRVEQVDQPRTGSLVVSRNRIGGDHHG